MFLSSILKICPLCSRLSSGLREFLHRLTGRSVDCRGVNQRTREDKRRVDAINAAAPDCVCENYRMSRYSPRPVAESEILARFIFSPMHIGKKGELKPSVFSHVHTVGCSIQRDSVARTDEIVAFVKQFLAKQDDFAWIGVLSGRCQNVRGITAGESNDRAVCVFDTAERENPAHGELCQTHYIVEEGDKLELRRNLFAAFGDGIVIQPSQYRNGTAWNQLPRHFQTRRTGRRTNGHS